MGWVVQGWYLEFSGFELVRGGERRRENVVEWFRLQVSICTWEELRENGNGMFGNIVTMQDVSECHNWYCKVLGSLD